MSAIPQFQLLYVLVVFTEFSSCSIIRSVVGEMASVAKHFQVPGVVVVTLLVEVGYGKKDFFALRIQSPLGHAATLAFPACFFLKVTGKCLPSLFVHKK